MSDSFLGVMLWVNQRSTLMPCGFIRTNYIARLGVLVQPLGVPQPNDVVLFDDKLYSKR